MTTVTTYAYSIHGSSASTSLLFTGARKYRCFMDIRNEQRLLLAAPPPGRIFQQELYISHECCASSSGFASLSYSRSRVAEEPLRRSRRSGRSCDRKKWDEPLDDQSFRKVEEAANPFGWLTRGSQCTTVGRRP